MNPAISFFVNGKQYEVPDYLGSDTSLLSFIRKHLELKGTKYMCKEGACGACIVNYKTINPITQEEKSFAVNSCLLPIMSCNGALITTIEGIGNKRVGYHPLQQVLANFHGTQCGYCSPGMIMNMYSLLTPQEKLTMKYIEESFGGNNCRCTGYRSILDAFKSLASDTNETFQDKITDIEDVWNSCQSKNDLKNCGKCLILNCNETKRRYTTVKRKIPWCSPESIGRVIELFKNNEDYQLVAGNTSQGVYRTTQTPELYINLCLVKELKKYTITQKFLEIGANMTLTEVIELFIILSKENHFKYLNILADHIKLIANVPVRNVATLAGNLMIKYYHQEFPSDLFVLLATCGASIVTVSGAGEEIMPVEKLLNKKMERSIIKQIILPNLSTDYCIKTFKIMPKAQNALCLINAGFLFRLNENDVVIKRPNIVYGCINSDFVHASKTEDYFTGKNFFDGFKKGTEVLSKELTPHYSLSGKTASNKQLALNLFYKYALNLKTDVNTFYQSGKTTLYRPLSKGTQDYETNHEHWPLTKPINKVESIFQCSGEAEYVNDIPEVPGQLFGALVLAEQAIATIKSIDPSDALAITGVVAFYSAKDIPGKNIFTRKGPLITDEEELFCSGNVLYAGQPVGVLIAETEELAYKAAKLVKISFGDPYLKNLCLCVKDVLDAGEQSRVKHFETVNPQRKIYKEKNIKKLEGQIELGPQFHFTMEPQSCVCIPSEDGLKIYPSTQWMSCIQRAVSELLNIEENCIDIEVKRIGGGFGSKITRASLVATACALASFKLNLPVKMILDIETNMKAIGKRNASFAKYEVEFHDDGLIEWLEVFFYSDEGCSENDCSIMLVKPGIINCYDSSGWKMNLFSVSTSTPSSSWMRAPGTLEGMALIEEVFEHISFALKKDPLEVRKRNIAYQFNFIEKVIETIEDSSNYLERRREVESFNKENRWKKKGISLVPMAFSLAYFFNLGAMVSIYGGDGTVSITHAGVEMGQGVNTKAIQMCASTLGIEERKIKVKTSSVLTSPNAHLSGASITSDNIIYSTMKACEILNERLEPIRSKYKGVSWEEIISRAFSCDINLNASYFPKKKDELKDYMVYGTAVTEVEVDILTGQYQILRTDIVEDAGESINPEIDVGQIEGGFVMGLGYFLAEHIKYDPKTGLSTNYNTLSYFVPGPKDIPIDFRVTLLKNAPNPSKFMRSKATGEPPICLASTAIYALRNALLSAQEDSGHIEWIPFSQPLSVERICQAAKTSIEHYSF